MKQYLNYFKWLFGIVGILVIIYGVMFFTKDDSEPGERTNGECLTQERVFDYGDVLTDAEEDELRSLIAEREKQAGCDIVLVTLNESLKEYAREREADVPYDEFVRVYAEEFYDENGFGYNKPIGDGVILVDNWYREDDGSIYTWFCAVGAADEFYSYDRIQNVLDEVYDYIEVDAYMAYEAYINQVYYDMTGKSSEIAQISGVFPFGVAVIAMIVFIIIHWNYKKGKKTVVATTYVNGGRPQMNRKEDVLIDKRVTKRRIQTSSSSGGGGGSHSHGGHHGGGGRSR